MRVGEGFDIHRLVPERKLFIGGIEIPSSVGAQAHSDGDVLIHAIVDAILGALSLGDIGNQYPDTDSKYKNISSEFFLNQMVKLLNNQKYKIVNIDSTVILEKPKLSPFISKMVVRLSELLNIDNKSINVKAKTNEGMGEIGRGEAVAAKAVVLLCNS